jgi:PRTRC genetic system protein E
MLFSNIAALVAKGVTINFTVTSADEGKLEVNVVPSIDSGKTGMGLVARSFTATPAELDAEFPAIMNSYANANLTLKQQLDAAEAAIEAAGKEAAASAAAKAAEKAAAKPVTHTVSKPGAKAANRAPTLSDDTNSDDDADAQSSGAQSTSESGQVAFAL